MNKRCGLKCEASLTITTVSYKSYEIQTSSSKRIMSVSLEMHC